MEHRIICHNKIIHKDIIHSLLDLTNSLFKKDKERVIYQTLNLKYNTYNILIVL
jgi:hypothetical protein